MPSAALPAHVDVRRIFSHEATVEGTVAAENLPRLQECLVPGATVEVSAKLHFSREQGQRFIRGEVRAQGAMFCQRCLAPMPVSVQSELELRLLSDEASVADYDSTDDVLVCEEESLNLISLVEDEVMLSLPLAPRHAVDECEAALPAPAAPDSKDADRDKPFAQLAGLKAMLAGNEGRDSGSVDKGESDDTE